MNAYTLAGIDPEPPAAKPAADDSLEHQVALSAALRGADPLETRALLAEAQLMQVLEVAWKALKLAQQGGGDRRSRDLVVAEQTRQELLKLIMEDPKGTA